MTTATIQPQGTALRRGFKKITLTLFYDNEKPTIRNSFIGRWIVGDENSGPVDSAPPSDAWIDTGVQYSVALTGENGLVVYVTHKAGLRFPEMFEHRDLDALKNVKYLDRLNSLLRPYSLHLVAAVAEQLGQRD